MGFRLYLCGDLDGYRMRFFSGHAMSKNWIAVASAEHVRLGRSNGFMQVSHGKSAPLRRIEPGDRVVFYSPTDAFRGNDKLQSFTAIGVVKEGAPYQVDMGDGFSPFRRDVTWQTAAETPIRTLLEQLEFTKGNRNWGYQLRSGLTEISELDMLRIARAMGASLT
jgi:EVE domain